MHVEYIKVIRSSIIITQSVHPLEMGDFYFKNRQLCTRWKTPDSKKTFLWFWRKEAMGEGGRYMSFTLTFTNANIIKLRWQTSGCPSSHCSSYIHSPSFLGRKLQLVMKPQISTSGTSKKPDHLLLCQGARTAHASNQVPQFEWWSGLP